MNRAALQGAAPMAATTPTVTPLDLESTPRLLLAYEAGQDPAAVGSELARRGVLEARPRRPVGHYAAFLVARALDGVRTPAAAPGHHVVADGRRLQVHGRRVNGREEPSIPVHLDREEPSFDAFIFVAFRHDFSLWEAWILPRAAVLEHARLDATGWRLRPTGAWRGDPRVAPLALGA